MVATYSDLLVQCQLDFLADDVLSGLCLNFVRARMYRWTSPQSCQRRCLMGTSGQEIEKTPSRCVQFIGRTLNFRVLTVNERPALLAVLPPLYAGITPSTIWNILFNNLFNMDLCMWCIIIWWVRCKLPLREKSRLSHQQHMPTSLLFHVYLQLIPVIYCYFLLLPSV